MHYGGQHAGLAVDGFYGEQHGEPVTGGFYGGQHNGLVLDVSFFWVGSMVGCFYGEHHGGLVADGFYGGQHAGKLLIFMAEAFINGTGMVRVNILGVKISSFSLSCVACSLCIRCWSFCVLTEKLFEGL